MENFNKTYSKMLSEHIVTEDAAANGMTVKELIAILQNFDGDTPVAINIIENGYNRSDRYGVGMGLEVGGEFIEQERLSYYEETGCLW